MHTTVRIWEHLATRISVTLGIMALRSTSLVNAARTDPVHCYRVFFKQQEQDATGPSWSQHLESDASGKRRLIEPINSENVYNAILKMMG